MREPAMQSSIPGIVSDGVAGGCTFAPISGAHQLTPDRAKKQVPREFIY
jgi:hypothetical protein